MIWHHQLPIKGEVTFFLPSPPKDVIHGTKDPFKHPHFWWLLILSLQSFFFFFKNFDNYKHVQGSDQGDDGMLRALSLSRSQKHCSYFPLFVTNTVREEMFSFQWFHSFIKQQALCLGCPGCSWHACLLLLLLRVFGFWGKKRKQAVFALFA